MPKRKANPVRFQNNEKSWSFHCANENIEDTIEETPTPNKRIKVNRKSFNINIFRYQNNEDIYLLGKMRIGTSNNSFSEIWKKCKVNINASSIMTLNFDDDTHCVLQMLDNEQIIRDLMSHRIFKYKFSVELDTKDVFLSLYFSDIPLKHFSKPVGSDLKALMTLLFNIDTISFDLNKKNILKSENLEELYNDINEHKENFLKEEYDKSIDVQHKQLLPKLRPYQEDAVKWMLHREIPKDDQDSLHPMYVPITLESREKIYFNIYTGYIIDVEPVTKYFRTGGILADEMGLGKTVEVLACILNNPRNIENDLNMPESNTKQEPEVDDEEEICSNKCDDTCTTINSCDSNNDEFNNFELSTNEDTFQGEHSFFRDDNSRNNDSIETNTSTIESESSKTEYKKRNDSVTESKEFSPKMDYSSDNESFQKNVHDETIPTIELQPKYVKPKLKPVTKVQIKKPDEEKSRKKLSTAHFAARLWYENKLAEMKIVIHPKKIKQVEEVQCICGDFSREGVVKCIECHKMQHKNCMSYKGKRTSYICSQCWTKKPLIKSKATLIVAPMSICRQWSLEIQNHIRKNGLRVLEYKGIHNAGVIYPTDLANYDLVITSYGVLQSELKFVAENTSSLSLRHAKRYNAPSTPLIMIEWWRLCLDEAQTVECSSNHVSSMAQQLQAVHRWAVTGTPMQKNIRDLAGLIDYLHISPFDDLDTWNNILYYPYINGNKKPLIEFLANVMWRTAKSSVEDQINIPAQSFEENWLEFSAVEKYFYKREHELCAFSFLEKLNKFDSFDITLKSIDRHTLSLILLPLLNLRQICNHPKVTGGKYLATRRQVNTMEELLDALISKNLNECEETLRAIIASLNGMAGILLLQERSLEAVDMYREALRYISKYENEGILKIDKLQRIHTLHNLSEVMSDTSYPTPPPTLRDATLNDECIQVQNKYMEKFIFQTHATKKDVQSASDTVKNLEKKLTLKDGRWCFEVINWCIGENIDNELLRKIDNVIETIDSKYEDFMTIKKLTLVISMWLEKIEKSSKKFRKYFEEFETEYFTEKNNYHISQVIVDHAMQCHLRPAKKKPKKNLCILCLIDRHLKHYEGIIFEIKTKEITDDIKTQGSWKPSKEELILKTIVSFAKLKNAEGNIISQGEIHVNICEALRKEFKELRKLYTFYDQLISAQDELNICKIRFRLRGPDESRKSALVKKSNILKNLEYELENKQEFLNVLDPYELDSNYDTLVSEMKMSEIKLKKSLGTYNYLTTLQKQQNSGQNTDPCPICRIQLQETWSIFQCGHCYCLDCIHKLLQQCTIAKYITCSVCRKRQNCDDIAYIKMKSNNKNQIEEVDVKGLHSTKYQAVLQRVLTLRHDKPDVKILIFSTWPYMLKILSDALALNDVKFETITNTNLQDKLQRFKSKKKGITVLLLPIKLGAKGLNLIEATHVFLIEPLMNPGEELQAIGRVHRIGQTKPTTVHRFLVKNTIEENIYNAVTQNTQKWEKNKLTLQQLKDLFTENSLNLTENESQNEINLSSEMNNE